MTKKNLFSITICLVFILGIFNTNVVFASTTDGTIDSTNKYAWGENIGWLNFGLTNGNVHVTNSGLTGYAWSEQYGWINMNANNNAGGKVTNNNGVLGGNAWGERLGWISFNGVTINSNGEFLGYATIASNGSRISFNCTNTSSCGASNFKVSTDWRPASTPHGGGGGSASPIASTGIPGCGSRTTGFSATTGQSCVGNTLTISTEIPGCGDRITGFSVTTGQSCIGNILAVSTEIPGCDDRTLGFSATTGQSCIGNTSTTPPITITTSSTICTPYLLKYIKLGANNDPIEVRKLQKFFNLYEKFNLKTDGLFGQKTLDAVRIFQKKYSKDILTPYGLTNPTGYVYKTTMKKINEIVCSH